MAAERFVATLWLALWMAAPALAVDQPMPLTLTVGEQRLLSSKNVASFSEGVEGVVDVRLTGDAEHFVVVGAKPGRTTLLLILERGGTRLYDIEVVDPAAASQDASAVVARHNVRLDFFFVQLEQRDDRDMGMRWGNQYGGLDLSTGYDFLAGGVTPSTAVVNTAVMPKLEMAENRGWAKVLRRAAVITATGTSADFSSGGEVNVPVVNAVNSGFQAIHYGSTVHVSPRYDEETGRIELTLQAEVAELTTAPGVDIPGRTTSTLKTLVNLELGQSLVLAGLQAHRETRSHGGVPGLSQVPILGGLFGMHSRRREHTENVIYIVPSLVEATRAETRAELERALDAYAEFEGGEVGERLPKGDLP